MIKRIEPTVVAGNSNETLKRLVESLRLFRDEWNSKLYPVLNSLPRGNTDSRWPLLVSMDALHSRFDASVLFVDNAATETSDGGVFWSRRESRPLTIKEALSNLSSFGSTNTNFSLLDVYANGEILGQAHTLDFTRLIGVKTSSTFGRVNLSLAFNGENGSRVVGLDFNTLDLGDFINGSVDGDTLTISAEAPTVEAADDSSCYCFNSTNVVQEPSGGDDTGKALETTPSGRIASSWFPFSNTQLCGGAHVGKLPQLNAQGQIPTCQLPSDNGPGTFILLSPDGRIPDSVIPESPNTVDYDCGMAGENNDVVVSNGSVDVLVNGFHGRRIDVPDETNDGHFLEYDSSQCRWVWRSRTSSCSSVEDDTLGLWLWQNNRNDSSGNGYHASAGGTFQANPLFSTASYNLLAGTIYDPVSGFTNGSDFKDFIDLSFEAWIRVQDNQDTSNSSVIGGYCVDTGGDNPFTASSDYQQSQWALCLENTEALSETSIDFSAYGNGSKSCYYDGTNVWVMLYSGSQVVRINPSTRAITGSVTGFDSTAGALFATSTADAVYVTDFTNNRVRRILKSDLSVTDISTTGSPWGIAYDGSQYIWVADSVNDQVRKIDTTSDTVVASVAVTNPTYIHYALGAVWAISASANQVKKIDPGSDTVVASANVASDPVGLSNDATYIYCAGFTSISRITATTGALLDTTSVGGPALTSILVDGTNVWLTGPIQQGGQVFRVKSSDLATITMVLRTYGSSSVGSSNIIKVGSDFWVARFVNSGSTGRVLIYDGDSFLTQELLQTAYRRRPFLYHRTANQTVVRQNSQMVISPYEWTHLAFTREAQGVPAPMATDGSTVSLLRFNEVSGSVVTDVSASHSATVTGTTISTDGFYSGDRARSFSTTGDYITGFTNDSDFRITGALSIECWLKMPTGSLSTPRHILSYSRDSYSTTADSWLFGLYARDTGPNNVWSYVHSNGGGYFTLDSAAFTHIVDSYVHVAVTRNGSTGLVKIYVDGELSASDTFALPTGGTNSSLRIGASQPTILGPFSAPGAYSGLISEIKISNVEKTAGEILSSYLLGRSYITQRMYINGILSSEVADLHRPNGGSLGELMFGYINSALYPIEFGCVKISDSVRSQSDFLSAYQVGVGY